MKKSRWNDVGLYRFSDDRLIQFIIDAQKLWCVHRAEALKWEGVSPPLEKNARLAMNAYQKMWYRAVRELAWRQAWDWLNERKSAA